MNCPNCGVPLMKNMVICPKCKFDTRTSDGGEEFRRYKVKLKAQKAEEARLKEEKARIAAEKNALLNKDAAERVKRFSGKFIGREDIVYHIEGARGRIIDVYPDKCVITTNVTLGSVLTQNATDGEKTIYYQDCIGLQIKYSGLALGYLQLETAAMSMNNSSSNFFNENSFTYEESNIDNHEMCVVVDYIKARLDEIKAAQRRMWFRS